MFVRAAADHRSKNEKKKTSLNTSLKHLLLIRFQQYQPEEAIFHLLPKSVRRNISLIDTLF